MRNIISAIIFAIAIILGSFLIGKAYTYKFKKQNSISVIGSADYNFTSDLIVWSASFESSSPDLKDAYTKLKNDGLQIQNYLSSHNISTSEIIFSSITIDKQYDNTYNAEGRQTGTLFKGYKLHQTVKIESRNIDNVEKISRDITQLIQSGIELNSEEPLYYYTKLSNLKINLLAKASNDAYNRANTIAGNTHGKIGSLKTASMGIFQITGQYSNETFTSMGAFNTNNKNKTANVTVRAEFEIN
ncbi:MAG: SIMPL domain-containing protein [Taibaiella sp.]|nr:SIMPL domain-containing protein [Taibaiella sp.]